MIPWIVPFAGAAAVAFAALMLAQRSLYAAAMCFLAVILNAAVLLYVRGAKLLALLLLLVYAGAVAVLIVISIQACADRMPDAGRGFWSRLSLPRPLLLAGLLLPVLDAALLLAGGGAPRPPAPAPAGDLGLGPALFGPYVAAAEAAAFLMLFADLAVIDPGETGP